jgi:hypothetical protein
MAFNKCVKNIVLFILFLVPIFFLTGCSLSGDKTSVIQEEKKAAVEKGQQDPQELVQAFMQATLGTIPNAEIDYDKARTMMTSQYAQEFTSPAFIPQAYAMQDGPSKVEFESKDIMGDTAEVVIMGYWGEDLQMRWKFELEKEDGLWKISFINPGQ